jgi:hypothetical protein
MTLSNGTSIYEIRVKGHLGPNALVWFDDFGVQHDADGATTLCGPIVDQAALNGILTRICDLGLHLLSFREMVRGEILDGES